MNYISSFFKSFRVEHGIFIGLTLLLIGFSLWQMRAQKLANVPQAESACQLFTDKALKPITVVCPNQESSTFLFDSTFVKAYIPPKDSPDLQTFNTKVKVPTGIFSDAITFWASKTNPTWLLHEDPWGNWSFSGIPWYLPFGLILLLMGWTFQMKLNREKMIREVLAIERINERKELAQLLHDGPLQELHFLGLEFQKFLMIQQATQEEKIRFREMQEKINTQIRNVCSSLRPNLMNDLGLQSSVEEYLEQMQSLYPQVHFESFFDSAKPIAKEKAAVVYGVICEAIQNALKHASPSHIKVEHQQNKLSVYNNGKSFIVPADITQFAKINHFGMVGMFERAKQIGAKINMISAPEAGTTITLNL